MKTPAAALAFAIKDLFKPVRADKRALDLKPWWPLDVNFDPKALLKINTALGSDTPATMSVGKYGDKVDLDLMTSQCAGGACTTAAEPPKPADLKTLLKSFDTLRVDLSPVARGMNEIVKTAERVLKTSAYAKAARACGFTFGRVNSTTRYAFRNSPHQLHLELPFSCVCGREEVFVCVVETDILSLPLDPRREDYVKDVRRWDLVEKLYELGSFSAKHLVGEDGYDPEVAADIEATFERVLVGLQMQLPQELKFRDHSRAVERISTAVHDHRYEV